METVKQATIKSSSYTNKDGWKVIWIDDGGLSHTTTCYFAKSKEQAEQDTLKMANEYLNPKEVKTKKARMISIMIDEANDC